MGDEQNRPTIDELNAILSRIDEPDGPPTILGNMADTGWVEDRERRLQGMKFVEEPECQENATS